MTKQFVKPDPDCALCHGTGEVSDSVDYGDTKVSMFTLCDCVEMQVLYDTEIVLVLDDTAMYRITINITVGEYVHAEYLFFHGTEKHAKIYAGSYLDTIWGEKHTETNYDNNDECYYGVEGERIAQLGVIEVYDRIPTMTTKGVFNFQPIGWRIE